VNNDLTVYATDQREATVITPAQVVFDTLPDLGMDRMTEGGVEFVLCASALTAQV
jgi:hypothetical protein